jgi:hypothetical protein
MNLGLKLYALHSKRCIRLCRPLIKLKDNPIPWNLVEHLSFPSVGTRRARKLAQNLLPRRYTICHVNNHHRRGTFLGGSSVLMMTQVTRHITNKPNRYGTIHTCSHLLVLHIHSFIMALHPKRHDQQPKKHTHF